MGYQLYAEKNVTSNSTEFVISGLHFRTSYGFEVNGFNEAGHGPPGNFIVVHTLQKGKYMQPRSALLDFLFCTNFFNIVIENRSVTSQKFKFLQLWDWLVYSERTR